MTSPEIIKQYETKLLNILGKTPDNFWYPEPLLIAFRKQFEQKNTLRWDTKNRDYEFYRYFAKPPEKDYYLAIKNLEEKCLIEREWDLKNVRLGQKIRLTEKAKKARRTRIVVTEVYYEF